METYAIFDDAFFRKKPWWLPKKLYQVVVSRANSREKAYMHALLLEKFPKAKLIEAEHIPQDAENIVLLYPDSIGLGWTPIEGKMKKYPNIYILNGRKRYFLLTIKTKIGLRLKRLLEITFLPELVFAPFLITLSIVWAMSDILRGRK